MFALMRLPASLLVEVSYKMLVLEATRLSSGRSLVRNVLSEGWAREFLEDVYARFEGVTISSPDFVEASPARVSNSPTARRKYICDVAAPSARPR